MLERVEGDAYVVLGLSRDADDAAVARAHRRLARRHHPDVAGDAASRRMMRINAAYDAIKTAERRAAYERDHRESTPHDGTGGAGDPPGNPSGSVVPFGRHVGWSLGEIARVDAGYLVWLADRAEGEPYRDEIDDILIGMGIPRRRAYATADGTWGRFSRS